MMCQVFNHLSKRSLKYQSSGRPQALTSIWGTPESAPAVPPLVGLLSHHGVHVRQCPVRSPDGGQVCRKPAWSVTHTGVADPGTDRLDLRVGALAETGTTMEQIVDAVRHYI